MATGSHASEELWRLLEERDRAAAERRPELDAAIWARFGRRRAVLISDMARFSRITRDHGVVHFLALIRRMESLCRPIIEAHRGHLCKGVADNLFATFDDPRSAVAAAFAMQEGVREDGHGRVEHEQIRLSIGIAAGEILDIDGIDLFGDPVNLAAKLGEDIGSADDILVTADAAAEVELPAGWRAEARVARISEVEVEHVALLRV